MSVISTCQLFPPPCPTVEPGCYFLFMFLDMLLKELWWYKTWKGRWSLFLIAFEGPQSDLQSDVSTVLSKRYSVVFILHRSKSYSCVCIGSISQVLTNVREAWARGCIPRIAKIRLCNALFFPGCLTQISCNIFPSYRMHSFSKQLSPQVDREVHWFFDFSSWLQNVPISHS